MNFDIGEYEPFHGDLAADALSELSDSDDQHTDMIRGLLSSSKKRTSVTPRS